MKTAIAAALITGLALVGLGSAGAASAEGFPLKTGFSSQWECATCVMDNGKPAHEQGGAYYNCVQSSYDGTWTAVWIVP